MTFTVTWANHLDMALENIQRNLGAATLTAEETLSFIIAAIRETFEEAGALLGRRKGSDAAGLESLLELRGMGRLESGWFKTRMTAEDWILSVSSLHRWSHWITPRQMKFRFDTRFFLAPIPNNQVCRPDKKETTHGLWITPREVLAGNLSGETPLSPPAVVTLHALLAHDSLDNFMKGASNRSWGDVIEPQLVPMAQGAMIIEPWDPMYGREHIRIKKTMLEDDVLGPEEPFSRLWNNGRLWRPVRVKSEYEPVSFFSHSIEFHTVLSRRSRQPRGIFPTRFFQEQAKFFGSYTPVPRFSGDLLKPQH